MKRDVDLGGLDIQTYLAEHQRKDLLRFLTCGNVDDGKSTLIGRLLHDAKSLYEDQLAAVRADSERFNTTGGEDIDLALLVDGLQAEREQGITIDVAYRYFSTSARKFIIADTPGHEQYTRNMATGASTCDLAIILIDARHGVRPQTKRHSFIASLLGIRSLVVAVNKMDAVGYAESRFEEIRREYLDFAGKLGLQGVVFLPLSALRGDNVVNASQHMPWYEGPTLLRHLETVPIASGPVLSALRFPVQWVNRPNLDFRGYCGTIASGEVRPGDEVLVLPSGRKNRVKSVLAFEGPLEIASAGMAVTLTLENEVDISRGDLLVHPQGAPSLATEAEAMLVWMSEAPLVPGREYFIKHTTKRLKASVQEIAHRVNIHTLEREAAEQLALNEIAQVRLSFSEPLAFDSYEESRATGAFIVIDRLSNNTVGAGMLLASTERPRAQQTSERPAHSPEPSTTPSRGTGAREPYADIARLYELEYAPFTADADFYARRLAPKRASVLELGCGGGRVALALARAGHRVTGLDISEAMLEIGRQRAEAEKLPVRFLAQDIAGFSLGERFDAVILSFSIFAFLPNAEARARCLESCKAHLAEGGRVFVDHFVPDLSTLARGESALRYVKTFRDSEGPAIVNKFEATKYEAASGRLWCEERYEVHPFTGPSERFGGTLPLSVLFPEEMVLLFERHGLITTARFGGYSEEAFTPESARHIFIAEAL